jgi:hypothetical protein
MSIHTTLWAYLWDLVDDGLEAAVRRCRDELGLDGLSVAAAYHSVQQLRPAAVAGKLFQARDAALYFQPDPAAFRDTRLRPLVAPLAQQGDPWGRLAACCHGTGLELTAWTVCLHNTYLAWQCPDLAQVTAYGDSLGWALCPGCDDVRAYVVALARQLVGRYGVHRVELESCHFGGYGHSHYHAKDGVELGNFGAYLFSLSFSPGCRARAQAAGIDVDELQAWVRRQLDPVLAGAPPLTGDLATLVAAQPALAAFQQLREDIVTSLVGEVRAAVAADVSFIVMGDRWTGGVRPDRLAPVVECLETLAYTSVPAEVQAQVEQLRAAANGAGDIRLGLQLYPPAARSAAALAANVNQGLALGVNHFSFYNYGIAPRTCLGWLPQALASLAPRPRRAAS